MDANRGNRSGRSRLLVALVGAVAAALAVTSVAVPSVLTARDEEAGSGGAADPADPTGRAKNVIFMMGDGMGPAQRDAIQLATVGAYDRLTMDQLPVEGMVGTNSVASTDPATFVTDSAAGATAFATGVKTYNGAISVDPDGNVLPTIVEQAKAAGKSVGLVTTSQVTDASPAAFGAHVKDRDLQSEIARQYIEDTKVDVILGGGEDYWYPKGDEGAFSDKPGDEEVSQSDRGNLVKRAQKLGYEYVTNGKDLTKTDGRKVLGLFANEEMFQQAPEGEGASYDPRVPLPQMTSKAINLLSRDPQGFFLFVEEEGIDEMGHYSNGPLQIKSGQKLDQAVGVAKNYTDKSGDTLQIVTADHECCGLTVEALDDPEYPDENGDEIKGNVSGEDGPFKVANSNYKFIMDYTTTSHTGVDVPLTATGPGAGQLAGNYENTAIYGAMARSLGVGR